MNGINAFPPKAFGSDSYFGSGGFFPNGAGAVDPDTHYGSMKGLFTVTRDGATGLFLVTMNAKMTAPSTPRIGLTPVCKAGSEYLVVRAGAWDNTIPGFRIQATDFAGAAADVAADPDAAIEFTFELTNHDRAR